MSNDLRIAVDPRAAEPPSEQVRSQIARLIESGRLLPGDRLPTVRALAADLGLAANTVARTYKHLEAAGLVETRSRAGTTVAEGGRAADVALVALATRFAAAARSARVSDERAVELLRDALRLAP